MFARLKELWNLSFILPALLLIVGSVLATREHNWSESYLFFKAHPFNGIINMAVLGYFMPRIGYFLDKKNSNIALTKIQQYFIWILTIGFVALAFYVLK